MRIAGVCQNLTPRPSNFGGSRALRWQLPPKFGDVGADGGGGGGVVGVTDDAVVTRKEVSAEHRLGAEMKRSARITAALTAAVATACGPLVDSASAPPGPAGQAGCGAVFVVARSYADVSRVVNALVGDVGDAMGHGCWVDVYDLDGTPAGSMPLDLGVKQEIRAKNDVARRRQRDEIHTRLAERIRELFADRPMIEASVDLVDVLDVFGRRAVARGATHLVVLTTGVPKSPGIDVWAGKLPAEISVEPLPEGVRTVLKGIGDFGGVQSDVDSGLARRVGEAADKICAAAGCEVSSTFDAPIGGW